LNNSDQAVITCLLLYFGVWLHFSQVDQIIREM